ncbi:MAG: hypothetical protein ACM30G_07555 [Micromonosporaceae bacterium]
MRPRPLGLARLAVFGPHVAGLVVTGLVVTGLLVNGLLVTGCGGAAAPSPPTNWPLPADAGAAARAAGLPMLGQEMLDVHYHAHLDVIVRGQKITVPAYVGIDAGRKTITALHTHDTSGIVHIESAADIPFTLGQFFNEWGQRLTVAEAGPVAATSDEEVRVYRNGKLVAGDPTAVKFEAHDEIVVWLGLKSENPKVPAGFTFPNGL